VIGNRVAVLAVSCACALFAATTARADPSADQTLAQTLFDEAVKLMDKGQFADACPKLAESQRLDPGGGTLLNLGFCRQNEGKLASAWAAYNEALSQAIKDGRKDREGTARVHVDELEGKYSKLAIDVTDGARKIEGLEIRVDGTPVRAAAWGVLSPIDRGAHGIVVSAPGKKNFNTSIEVSTDGTTQRVSIPVLENAPIPIDRTRGAGTERVTSRGQVIVGVIATGVGVAALGVGIGSGAAALDAKSQADKLCNQPAPGGTACDQNGFDTNERAKTYAWLADFGIGLGAAAIIGGVVLVLTATKTVRITPAVGPTGAGAMLYATF
jgi:hypothetical protein